MELGGKYIVVGSDAHRASELGSYFDEVYKTLREMGVDEITVYERRKPILKKI